MLDVIISVPASIKEELLPSAEEQDGSISEPPAGAANFLLPKFGRQLIWCLQPPAGSSDHLMVILRCSGIILLSYMQLMLTL